MSTTKPTPTASSYAAKETPPSKEAAPTATKWKSISPPGNGPAASTRKGAAVGNILSWARNPHGRPIGHTFRIRVNDVLTLHLIDDHTVSGIIGFQIHQLTRDLRGGAVYVRNVRILTDEPANQHRATTLTAADTRES